MVSDKCPRCGMPMVCDWKIGALFTKRDYFRHDVDGPECREICALQVTLRHATESIGILDAVNAALRARIERRDSRIAELHHTSAVLRRALNMATADGVICPFASAECVERCSAAGGDCSVCLEAEARAELEGEDGK